MTNTDLFVNSKVETLEIKETFNAEEIIEGIILNLKKRFDELSAEESMPGYFNRAMVVSEEIRKLTECWLIVKNTPKTGVCDVSGYWTQVQANPTLQEIEPVECYEIESLDQIVQVALDLTLDLVKKDSKTYEDVFDNFKKIEDKFEFIREADDREDMKQLLLKQAAKMINEEVKQTKVLL